MEASSCALMLRELNKAIKRENLQIPTMEDVMSCLIGKKMFTVIDLKKAFWQVPLSEESSPLTTFNTPFRRFFLVYSLWPMYHIRGPTEKSVPNLL